VLPDVLEPGLAVVFVGESAGETSAREGRYYAGRDNCFWSELAAAGITDRQLEPREFLKLPEYGVGLTDILKHLSDAKRKRMSRREWSRAIEVAAEDLRQRVASARPEAVCFVGLDPGREVGQHLFGWDGTRPRPAGLQVDSHLGEVQVWLCPSTSAAPRAFIGNVRRVLSELYEHVVRPWQNRKR
jgi:TDG/mug DNA glycosylase family protein